MAVGCVRGVREGEADCLVAGGQEMGDWRHSLRLPLRGLEGEGSIGAALGH